MAIYSDEWMSEVATRVQEPLRPVVRAICEEYQLGGSEDPNLLSATIEREIAGQLSGWQHRIRVATDEEDAIDLKWVQPEGLEYDFISGRFYYVAGGTYYAPDDIVARRKA